MKKAKRIGISLLSVLLTLVLLAGSISPAAPMEVYAKSSSQIKKEIDDLEEEREKIEEELAELDNLVTANMTEMEKAMNEKSAVDQQVALLYQQMDTINKQIVAYGTLIAEKQVELEAAEAALAQMKEDNKARIRAMEKNSMTASYWAVVFEAEDFLDMLDQLKMVAQIQEADKQMIKKLSEAAEQVEIAKEELETEKAALELKKAELEETEKQLEAKKAQAEAILEELMLKNEEYQKLVHDAEQIHSEMSEELEKLETAYDAAKYQEYLATLPPPKPNPGGAGNASGGATSVPDTSGESWGYPTNYINFSSAYGWRKHPVYGDMRFHHGVDLGAYQGTPIYAARSGTVTIASYDWSSGYWVNISHGDGFTSRYLHMTHYIVSAGQYVSKGQVIGYVGSTGTSTGPHLHFGIYYNGVSQNPASYINF